MTAGERRERGQRLGRILIAIWKGDYCQGCGEHVAASRLHLHHRRGTVKGFNIGDWSQRPTRSLLTLAAELRKTDPLCRRCHDAEHREERRQRALAASRDNAGRFVRAQPRSHDYEEVPGVAR